MTYKTRVRRTGLRFFLTLSVVLLVGVLFAGPALAAPGSIKVNGDDISGGGNEPFQGCDFFVEFEGFTESPGGTAGVEITAQPPTADGVVGSGSTTLDADGNGSIEITIDPTGIEQHQQGLHVTITAGVVGGDGTKKKTVWVEECEAAAPTTPPVTTTPPTTVVPPPSGGVATGTAAGPGPSLLLPVIGLVLLVGSTLWMRRRSTS